MYAALMRVMWVTPSSSQEAGARRKPSSLREGGG